MLDLLEMSKTNYYTQKNTTCSDDNAEKFNSGVKLTKDDAKAIREYYAEHANELDAATLKRRPFQRFDMVVVYALMKDYGVSKHTICDCLAGRSWIHADGPLVK